MGNKRTREGVYEAQRRLARRLAAIDFALPGSLALRLNQCGKPGCRCKADPPQFHGPYYVWTRKAGGKTVTKLLTEDQAKRYRPWFENAADLRRITRELHALSIRALDEDTGR